jgi:hypothetical protein
VELGIAHFSTPSPQIVKELNPESKNKFQGVNIMPEYEQDKIDAVYKYLSDEFPDHRFMEGLCFNQNPVSHYERWGFCVLRKL